MGRNWCIIGLEIKRHALGHNKSSSIARRMKTTFFPPGWHGSVRTLALALTLSSAWAASDLEAPFRVEAAGKPIDTDIGHAAPLAADFDGDGRFDLLVGQFGEGKLKIYLNQGTAAAPKFSTFTWFKAEGAFGKVPAG